MGGVVFGIIVALLGGTILKVLDWSVIVEFFERLFGG